MKKLIAAVLAILCLAGCAAKKEYTPDAMPAAPVEQPVQTPVKEETPPPAAEVPVEINTPEAPKQEQAEQEPVQQVEFTDQPVEGLVGDAVGYILSVPVFSGYPAAGTINGFYTAMVADLEKYTEEKVHTQCLEKSCVANVYGEVTAVDLLNGELTVIYEYRVEYSNAEEPSINIRIDHFNVQTGEMRSE